MNVLRNIAAVGACVALAFGAAACGGDDNESSSNASSSGGSRVPRVFKGGTVTGAGATFAAPLYDQLGAEFKDQDQTTINYQSVGSGAGVAQFIANTVDYGASDVAAEGRRGHRPQAKGDPLNIPVAFGAVTVSYNLNGVAEGPQARRPDRRRHLPRQDQEVERPGDRRSRTRASICPTRTSRSSTAPTVRVRPACSRSSCRDYSPEWKKQVGTDKTVKWPTGTGSKGNEGVAGTSSRRRARSATSSSRTRCRTTSRRRR